MYKKIKKVVPFAVLSTAILLSPAATTFAAADTQADHPVIQNKVIGGNGSGGNDGGGVGPPPIDGDNGDDGGISFPGNNNNGGTTTGGSTQTSNYSIDKLKKDIADRFPAAFNNRRDKFYVEGQDVHLSKGVINDLIKNAEFTDLAAAPAYADGSFSTDAKVSRYEDAGQVELLTYKNAGVVNQTWNSSEKSIKTSESFMYSNKEGAKLGVASETKVGVQIPFVAEGGETIKISTEFSYEHTSTNTSTKEETVTFKSQPVVCVPGYITTYVGTVKNAVFSGTFSGTGDVVGDISYNFILVNGKKIPFNTKSSASQDIRDHAIYNVFKYSGMPIPDYVKLDDATQTVRVSNIVSTYEGVGGHYSEATLHATPINGGNDVAMPYEEYMKKAQDGTLKQFLDEKTK